MIFAQPSKEEKKRIIERYQSDMAVASAHRSFFTPDLISWQNHQIHLDRIQERYEKQMGYRPL